MIIAKIIDNGAIVFALLSAFLFRMIPSNSDQIERENTAIPIENMIIGSFEINKTPIMAITTKERYHSYFSKKLLEDRSIIGDNTFNLYSRSLYLSMDEGIIMVSDRF